MTPDWLLTAIWFIAGVFGTGAFWFFLSSHSRVGAILSACGALGSIVIVVALHRRNDRLRNPGGFVSAHARLLSFVWMYPLSGESQASWAVKESAVLRGNLGTARDEPGLGVAIVTTELALTAFGNAAASRIDRCIRWALEHSEREPPFQIVAGLREQSSGETVDVRPDLRHTLAFGVILARNHRYMPHLDGYVRLAIGRQREGDGGWPADSVATISPVFTAIYAVEMLHLASSDSELPPELRIAAARARDRGICWLLDNRDSSGLWSSGNLVEFAWDEALTTAWVLHRLIQTAKLSVPAWSKCLDRALSSMIELTLDSQTWAGCDEEQRQRVEARVAAAVSRSRQIGDLCPTTKVMAETYMGMWRDGAIPWARSVRSEDLDVATAAFMVQALGTPNELQMWGRSIVVE